jgi:hypothetical protein
MNSLEHRRPARRPGVWLRRAGQEVALFDQHRKAVHLVNDSAAAIWDLCDGSTEPDEMIEAICTISGMPREIVVDDVERILGEFEEAGLITWAEGRE